jgi:hypothetical protein
MLANSDPFLGDLGRQSVGSHAVDADLIIVVAEGDARRDALDEPIAGSPSLKRCAVHCPHGFERGYYGPADVGYRINRIAFVCRLREKVSAEARRHGKDHDHEGDKRYRPVGHAISCGPSHRSSGECPPNAFYERCAATLS